MSQPDGVSSRLSLHLAALPSLSVPELRAISAIHEAVPRGDLSRARNTVWEVATRAQRLERLVEVERCIREWSTSLPAITGIDTGVGTAERERAEARRSAGPALIDHAAALLLEDLLDPDAMSLLLSSSVSTSHGI